MSEPNEDDDFMAWLFSEGPWADVEVRFAMMSVVVGARIWRHLPDEKSASLLAACVDLCDNALDRWKEAGGHRP